MQTSTKAVLLIKKCPGETDDEDGKSEFKDALERAFGDYSVVNCEKIRSESGCVLFCEMLINAEKIDREFCPDFAKIIRIIEH